MKRQANFEVLRVVAMAMIVSMHFLHKGGIIEPLTNNTTVVNITAWLIELLCIVAANCYMLIAGYFLVEAEWKLKKLFMLVAQVLFYSLLIPVVCLFSGIGDVAEWTIYDWLVVVLPLQMDHYWFATAYILVFMLSPILAAGVKALTKKQLEITILALLTYFCLFKTVCPLLLATDRYGYDYPWFICVFLVAAYIRLYGKQGLTIGKSTFLTNTKKANVPYILSVVFMLVFSLLLGAVNAKTGNLDHYLNMVHSYNSIFTVIASVSLFYVFLHWQPKDKVFVRFVCKIAPYTFGVYLIHENIVIRTLWPGWFGVEGVRGSWLFIPYMVLVVVVLFVICMTIDFVRKKLFSVIFK